MPVPPIQTHLEPDGLLIATIDMTDRTMNVFSVELMDALDTLMDRADTDAAVRAVVLTSGKTTFLAGADLVMVRGYTDAARHATHAQMFEMCGRLGRQFVRLEASAKPWVAAVNGLALGGGLELALACRARLVADDPKIQLGVPEVRWGLLPGAGGTQRLPRLAGFEPAMAMLLSGQPVAPDKAVALGVFARAVPSAELLDAARTLARSLIGQAYDAAVKYPHLAQTEVPADDPDTARAVALAHGISHRQFDLYPSYSAIVDSVLKGARLPLAQANAVEMNQFLRLMFNPVAGRMVRTLFLERLRAERELAAPPALRLARLVVGPISDARSAWGQALKRVKLTQDHDPALPADTLGLVDGEGRVQAVALRVLDEPLRASDTGAPLAVLCPAGDYGRVLEIVGPESATTQALAALAARLWCLPWRTPGPLSVLQQLHALPAHDQSALATRCAVAPGAGDPAFMDVAACLAGLSEAWTGGPLTWMAAERAAGDATWDVATEAAWATLRPVLAAQGVAA